MTDTRISEGILAFSHQFAAGRPGACALTVARSRRWLDEHGRVTDEGRELFQALAAQSQTRTVWRFLV